MLGKAELGYQEAHVPDNFAICTKKRDCYSDRVSSSMRVRDSKSLLSYLSQRFIERVTVDRTAIAWSALFALDCVLDFSRRKMRKQDPCSRTPHQRFQF